MTAREVFDKYVIITGSKPFRYSLIAIVLAIAALTWANVIPLYHSYQPFMWIVFAILVLPSLIMRNIGTYQKHPKKYIILTIVSFIGIMFILELIMFFVLSLIF